MSIGPPSASLTVKMIVASRLWFVVAEVMTSDGGVFGSSVGVGVGVAVGVGVGVGVGVAVGVAVAVCVGV